jgi:Y_Y_Y domain/Two component regulator propeller
LEDDAGTLWFGTRDHGLYRYRGDTLTAFGTSQGLASNSIYQLLEDRAKRLWLSGPNSISSIGMHDLLVQSESGQTHLAVKTYPLPFTADGAEIYGGRQPSGCLGKDGGVWFPSNKGAVHVLPGPQAPFAPPRLLITGAVSDGRELATGASFSLPADSSRLEIAYAPLMLRAQESVRFRYRLEPYDSEWTYVGTNRQATYTNLPAGNYRFRVATFEVDNPSVVSEAALDFRKEPHFYATWWFLSGCIVVLTLFIWIA